jgi:hypothetical protein
MNPGTAKALAQFSVILVFVGIIVGDPLAGFFFFMVAVIFNALALAFGTKRVRLFALILLVFIIALALWQYPDARRHFERYRDRVHADRSASIRSGKSTMGLVDCETVLHSRTFRAIIRNRGKGIISIVKTPIDKPHAAAHGGGGFMPEALCKF